MSIKIELHSVDDWEAIYVDGVCDSQNHSNQLEEYLFRHFMRREGGPLTIDSLVSIYHEDDAIADHVQSAGRFPEKLTDFKQIEIEAKRAELRRMESDLDKKRAEVEELRSQIEGMEPT